MNAELNPGAEMLRRFLFALFVLCSVAILWLIVSVRIDWHFGRFAAILYCLFFAAVDYWIGCRFFEFATIRETFLLANVPPLLAPALMPVYRRTCEVVGEMRRDHLKPMERQRLRNQLTELVADAPQVFKLLEDEILAVHPTICRP